MRATGGRLLARVRVPIGTPLRPNIESSANSDFERLCETPHIVRIGEYAFVSGPNLAADDCHDPASMPSPLRIAVLPSVLCPKDPNACVWWRMASDQPTKVPKAIWAMPRQAFPTHRCLKGLVLKSRHQLWQTSGEGRMGCLGECVTAMRALLARSRTAHMARHGIVHRHRVVTGHTDEGWRLAQGHRGRFLLFFPGILSIAMGRRTAERRPQWAHDVEPSTRM